MGSQNPPHNFMGLKKDNLRVTQNGYINCNRTTGANKEMSCPYSVIQKERPL
jgi:hypothetical protein